MKNAIILSTWRPKPRNPWLLLHWAGWSMRTVS